MHLFNKNLSTRSELQQNSEILDSEHISFHFQPYLLTVTEAAGLPNSLRPLIFPSATTTSIATYPCNKPEWYKALSMKRMSVLARSAKFERSLIPEFQDIVCLLRDTSYLSPQILQKSLDSNRSVLMYLPITLNTSVDRFLLSSVERSIHNLFDNLFGSCLSWSRICNIVAILSSPSAKGALCGQLLTLRAA